MAFINFLTKINGMYISEIHYMDSTLITMWLNHKIYSYKVSKTEARRSKSTKGCGLDLK